MLPKHNDQLTVIVVALLVLITLQMLVGQVVAWYHLIISLIR